jgi:hypothetical protein
MLTGFKMAIVAGVASLTFPSGLSAHGMMSGEDVSRPLSVAGGIAFTSYWIVLLWPKRKKTRNDGHVGTGRSSQSYRGDPSAGPRPYKRGSNLRQVS